MLEQMALIAPEADLQATYPSLDGDCASVLVRGVEQLVRCHLGQVIT